MFLIYTCGVILSSCVVLAYPCSIFEAWSVVVCCVCECGLSYFPLCRVHSGAYYHSDRFTVCQYAWAHVRWHAYM